MHTLPLRLRMAEASSWGQCAVRRKNLRIAHAIPVQPGNSNALSVAGCVSGSRRYISLVSWVSCPIKGGMAEAGPGQAPLKQETQARGIRGGDPHLNSIAF